jgi:uncharacterized protein (TIGR02271 family)
MAQKIVGFYRDRSTADQVKEELINSGFDRSSINTFAGQQGQEGPSFWQEVKNFFGFAEDNDRELYAEATRRGGVAVAVSVDGDQSGEESRAIAIMQRHQPMDLDRSAEDWRAKGWQGSGAASQARGPAAGNAMAAGSENRAAQGANVVPVVEEELKVGKRQVQSGGVRIHTRVTERPVEQQVQLREEHVSVERRPADRPINPGDEAFRERIVQATATSEEAVVGKTARVVEEVVVNKDVEQKTQTVRDTVRRTDVEVERPAAGAQRGQTSGQGQFAPDQFVSQLSQDPRFRGRDWDSLEPEARRSFEERYPGSAWEQFKEVIHRGYDKVRQRT